jgi:transcriptional regulator with XRE-family HTH domain
MQVGERVREVRRRRKMTVAGLAAASELTKGFISQVESGRSNPSLASLGRISQALGVPLSVLIATEDDEGDLAFAARRPVVLTTGSHHDNPGLAALTGMQAGTHFLATLPPGFALTSTSNPRTYNAAVAVLVVLRGSADISQGNSVTNITSGELSTWDPRGPCALENRGNSSAHLLIFLPSGCTRPALVPVGTRKSMTAIRSHYAAPAEGPLRLVAMRAQRQTERRR